MSTAPVFHIDLKAFRENPYPQLKQMRAKASIAFVPELNRTLFTRLDDIKKAEPDVAHFSSEQPGGLMTVLMGENMMRKGGAAHAKERKAIFPTVSPKTVRDHWSAKFAASADEILDDISSLGEGDLFQIYAMRLSGEALRVITGLESLSWREMDAVSQAMIDGISNYAGDKAVEATCHRATTRIDEAITSLLKTGSSGYDMCAAMMAAGLPEEQIRANIKLAISGGQNEPRDVIAGIIWALLSHPAQLELALSGEVGWQQVMAEYVRWIAPIGMTPRRIAAPTSFNGIDFETGDDVFFMFNSANHDEKYFEHPEAFDITRDASKHIAFGAGPHFCAGAWVAKALIADVALPKLFARLTPHLSGRVHVGGWAFRGVLNLPCRWQA
ncbi:MAG: cytochrome P450 [Rhodobacteraceae bacterium]|nr:cytochrome P450 [Paracoccaceae bacterium]